MPLVVVLASCTFLAPVKDSSRYFILTPGAAGPAQSAAVNGANLSVGLGPLKLPGYLQRRELVTRVAGNQLRFSASDLWAESLPESFRDVLSQDLSNRLGGARIVAFPWYSSTPLDYAVAVNVSHFECDSAADCELIAEVVIGDGHGRILRRENARIVTHAGGSGGDAEAAALSTNLERLSGRIATAIDALAAAERTRALR